MAVLAKGEGCVEQHGLELPDTPVYGNFTGKACIVDVPGAQLGQHRNTFGAGNNVRVPTALTGSSVLSEAPSRVTNTGPEAFKGPGTSESNRLEGVGTVGADRNFIEHSEYEALNHWSE